MSAPLAAASLARNKHVRAVVLVGALLLLLGPVLVVGAAFSVFSQSAAQGCGSGGEVEQAAGGGAVAGVGLAAQPLRLQAGRSYEVGATEYGGPSDPSSGSYGSIPDPSQAYLPAHPDSFAELSVLAYQSGQWWELYV